MVIVEYERLLTQKGRVENVSLTLHFSRPDVSQPSDSSQSATSSVTPDPQCPAPAASSSGRNFQH